MVCKVIGVEGVEDGLREAYCGSLRHSIINGQVVKDGLERTRRSGQNRVIKPRELCPTAAEGGGCSMKKGLVNKTI